MKRDRLLTAALVLLLSLVITFSACAADIRPLAADHDVIDLSSGRFRLTVKDADRIPDGGFFTAGLYLEDRYSTAEIEALAPGDTVLVNGRIWTVQDIVLHEGGSVIEIYTEEENDGYIVFRLEENSYLCVVDDWSPVSAVGEVRIMLPLPDAFEYYCDEERTVRDAKAFLSDLENYGNAFTAYNTGCVFENGALVSVTHADYPEGPSPEPAAAGEAVPVWQFCHGLRDGLETAVIRGYENDCEAGPGEIDLTPEEIEEIRSIALSGVITGKANDLSVTGGTWSYSFETPEGVHLLSIELYKGWIVSADGMYSYSK